jgi:hypothetical protein
MINLSDSSRAQYLESSFSRPRTNKDNGMIGPRGRLQLWPGGRLQLWEVTGGCLPGMPHRFSIGQQDCHGPIRRSLPVRRQRLLGTMIGTISVFPVSPLTLGHAKLIGDNLADTQSLTNRKRIRNQSAQFGVLLFKCLEFCVLASVADPGLCLGTSMFVSNPVVSLGLDISPTMKGVRR